MSTPAISVVIPTYNRAVALHRCLSSLEAQTLSSDRYEVLVIDDDSTDGTTEMLAAHRGLRAFRQGRNAGPASARNVGIRAAAGTHLLFLDDDVIAPPTLLESHLQAHAAAGGEHVAILGDAPWPAGQELTPVMRAVFDARVHNQTSYDTIVDSDDVSYRYFWTCHVSLRRSFLLAHGLFDEQFRWAYGEDTELAYRLIRHGLRILFRREIAVTHDHLPSYTSARRRQRIAGEVACLMARKHPELVDLRFVHLSPKSRAMNWMKRRVVETAIDPLLDLADRRRWELPLLTRAYRWVLDEHQLWGLLDALAATGDAPIMPVVT